MLPKVKDATVFPQKAHGSASEDDGTPKKKQKKPLDSRFGGNDRGADNGNVTTRPPQAWTGDSVC